MQALRNQILVQGDTSMENKILSSNFLDLENKYKSLYA